MTIGEIVALASVLISVGMNVGLYVHLSSVMNTRFDSVERRLEPIQGDIEGMVRHYVGMGVHYFQPYNEPNLSVEQPDGVPSVDRYLIYNEPNQKGWLQPQWSCTAHHRKCTPVSPDTYRDLVRAAVPQVHKADPHSEAVIGELAPVGNRPISDETPMSPLTGHSRHQPIACAQSSTIGVWN